MDRNAAMAMRTPSAISGPGSGNGRATLFFLPVIMGFDENCKDCENYGKQSVPPIGIPASEEISNRWNQHKAQSHYCQQTIDFLHSFPLIAA